MSHVTKDGFWIEGEDGEEFIVQSPRLMHDEFTAERHSKIVDALNSIGCTSFMLTAEQINSLIKQYNFHDDTELMEEQKNA